MAKWSISVVVITMITILLLTASHWNTKNVDQLANEVLAQRVSLAQLKEQHKVLSNKAARDIYPELIEDLTRVQIRMAELFKEKYLSDELTPLSFKQFQLGLLGDDKNKLITTVTRVIVRSTVFDEPQLLRILSSVDTTLGIWPSEVIGCDVSRADTDGLRFQCIIDYYHWTL